MTSPDENAVRQTVERFYHAVSEKSVTLLRDVVTPDWEYLPPPAGAVTSGPEQMTQMFDDLAKGLPDMKVTIVDLLVSGHRVGVRAMVSGTHHGELFGIAATSKKVEFAIHSLHELRGDVIAKTWHLEDWLSAFRQIGQSPDLRGRG